MQHARRQDLLDQWTQNYSPLRGLDMPRLVRAFEEAEHGKYADIQWINRAVGRRDPLVRAVNCRMTSALRELEWTIATPDAKELEKSGQIALAQAQKSFLLERYNAIDNLWQAITFLSTADFKGYSHLEIHRDLNGWPLHLEPVEQWHWYRKSWYGDWLYNPKALQTPREIYPIDTQNWIIREIDDPAYEIFATAFLRKNLASKDWDGFIENFGIPWIFLVLPPGLTPEQQTEWQDRADDITSDGRGTLPHGSDIKEASAANRGIAPFVDYLRRQDEDIVLTATGGLLTLLNDSTGLGSGQSDSHQDAWHEIVGGVARDIAELLQTALDKPLLQRQFPGAPVLAWFDLSRPEQSDSADSIADMVLKLHQAGHSVSPQWIMDRTGVEIDDVSPTVPAGGHVIANRSGRGNDTLAATAMADALQIADGYLRPLQPLFDKLLKLMRDDRASKTDFQNAAEKILAELPDVLQHLEIDTLAESLERSLGAAVATGALDANSARGRKKKR